MASQTPPLRARDFPPPAKRSTATRILVVDDEPLARWSVSETFGAPRSAIQLDSCRTFDWVVAKTSRSVYDLVVLPGDAGEVLVRGGRFLP